MVHFCVQIYMLALIFIIFCDLRLGKSTLESSLNPDSYTVFLAMSNMPGPPLGCKSLTLNFKSFSQVARDISQTTQWQHYKNGLLLLSL